MAGETAVLISFAFLTVSVWGTAKIPWELGAGWNWHKASAPWVLTLACVPGAMSIYTRHECGQERPLVQDPHLVIGSQHITADVSLMVLVSFQPGTWKVAWKPDVHVACVDHQLTS